MAVAVYRRSSSAWIDFSLDLEWRFARAMAAYPRASTILIRFELNNHYCGKKLDHKDPDLVLPQSTLDV